MSRILPVAANCEVDDRLVQDVRYGDAIVTNGGLWRVVAVAEPQRGSFRITACSLALTSIGYRPDGSCEMCLWRGVGDSVPVVCG